MVRSRVGRASRSARTEMSVPQSVAPMDWPAQGIGLNHRVGRAHGQTICVGVKGVRDAMKPSMVVTRFNAGTATGRHVPIAIPCIDRGTFRRAGTSRGI
jgi:alcohol dehydrogenase class IV